MANTFRLNWFRKLINSCSATRKYRHIDDSHPIASTSDLKNLKSSEKVPRLPEKTNSAATRPAKSHKRQNIAMTVRMHSVVRNLNRSNKQLRNVTLDTQKRGRNAPLANTPTSGIPLRSKIFTQRKQTQQPNDQRIGYQYERDLVASRNVEKLVREWQARLQNRRRDKKKPAVTGRESSGVPVKFTKKNTQKSLFLALDQGKNTDKDVKFARTSASSRSTDGPNNRNTKERQTYHMSIARFKVKNIKDHRKRPSKDIQKVPINKPKSKSKPPNPVGCTLVKEEQKRLDILKAEWVQLKGLENAARLNQTEKINKPKGPEAVAPTELDLESLIVDPKSFLTKVHVKSKFLCVDPSKTDDPTASNNNSSGFRVSEDGLPELGPD